MLDFSDNTLTFIAIYLVIVVAAFWLAMVAWTYRDMRARSRDPIGQIFVALMVAALTVPGLFIYLLLRPRETLAEAYERSLEEEALLQEIEEKPTCPGCAQRIEPGWQVCPHCHTRLKKPCPACKSMLELSWSICPHCASPQATYAASESPALTDYNAYISPSTTSTGDHAERRARRRRAGEAPSSGSSSLEFVDGE